LTEKRGHREGGKTAERGPEICMVSLQEQGRKKDMRGKVGINGLRPGKSRPDARRI